MTEAFIAILEEGPFPGNYDFPVIPEEGGPVRNWPEPNTWPLPKFIMVPSEPKGCYVRYWESKGTAKKGEARGAKYKWDANSLGKDLSQ